MSWYAMDVGLERHPKFQALVAARRWSPASAIGYLHRFWSAVRVFAPDGDVTGWDDRYLARTMGLSHSAVAGLREDMTAVGFLDVGPGGRTVVHGWERRNARWLRDAERKREQRACSRGGTEVPGAETEVRRADPPESRDQGPQVNGDAPHSSLRLATECPQTDSGLSADAARRAEQT